MYLGLALPINNKQQVPRYVETLNLIPISRMRRVRYMMDLRITHERWGSSSNRSLNEQLHYPNPSEIDRTLNEDTDDKIRSYCVDYTIESSL